MLKIVKSSVKDTVIYSLGTFASKLTGLILVPIYTNATYLPQTDYGVLSLVEANLQFITAVFGLGLSYAFERWYWDKGYLDKRKTIFYTILLTTIIIALVMLAALIPFASLAAEIIFASEAYANIFILMLVNASLEIIAQTPNSLIRLKERPGLFTMANIIKLVTSLTVTVVLLVGMQTGLKGVYYGQITGVIVYFIVLSRFIYTNTDRAFEKQVLLDMVRFRLPLILPIVAFNIFSFNDRFVLSNMIDLVHAGIYSLGYKLANTIKVFLITAVWLALTPTIYKMMNEPNNRRFYSKVMTYLSFVVMIAVLGLSVFSKELVTIFAKEAIYIQAYTVIPIISLGLFFGMLKDVSLIGLNITKKTSYVGIATIIVTLLNLGANLILVPELGIIGAAVSNLGAQFIFFTIIYYLAQREYSIPYEIGKVIKVITTGVALWGLSLLGEGFPLLLKIGFKLLLIASFPFLLRMLGFYEAIELSSIKGFWEKWKDPTKWKSNLKSLDF